MLCSVLTIFNQILDTKICLLHGRTPSVSNVALHSPTTAMVKILSATYIYDFYPSLTNHGIALTISKHLHESPAIVYYFGMRSYPINSLLYRDYNHVCPAAIRSTRGLVGISRLQWCLDEKNNFIDLHKDGIGNEEVMWRLSDHCCNHACDNAGRPESVYATT